MPIMAYTDLLWQIPAVFTAVPMAARMLPCRLAARAVPLFYFIVAVVVMALPGGICLALGAAGLVSMIHVRLGENISATDPPDMKEVAGKLALGWDYIVTHLQMLPWSRVDPGFRSRSIHDSPDDDNPDDNNREYHDPPRPPGPPPVSRIPPL
jgi:hypothetical protein